MPNSPKAGPLLPDEVGDAVVMLVEPLVDHATPSEGPRSPRRHRWDITRRRNGPESPVTSNGPSSIS